MASTTRQMDSVAALRSPCWGMVNRGGYTEAQLHAAATEAGVRAPARHLQHSRTHVLNICVFEHCLQVVIIVWVPGTGNTDSGQ